MRYHNLTNITKLNDNQVFVFGSNEGGIHGKGAAYTARKHFGAQLGVGVGPTGQSYAIPTKDENLKVLDIITIAHRVSMFIFYTMQFPKKEFVVTAIGCGLAGFKHEEMAPLFKDAGENVVLPDIWKPVIDNIKKG